MHAVRKQKGLHNISSERAHLNSFRLDGTLERDGVHDRRQHAHVVCCGSVQPLPSVHTSEEIPSCINTYPNSKTFSLHLGSCVGSMHVQGLSDRDSELFGALLGYEFIVLFRV